VPNADGGKNNTRDEKIRPDSNENHEDKTAENAKQQEASNAATTQQISTSMGKSPGEVAFFKLLHSEFKKATHFFDRATEEHAIREERVREGMEIMRKPNSIMVNEKWALMAKSIYRLYKDLLLLETFAIMTYCSFSKILKKHDKVTGYETKNAFMANIVNKANFTHYPKVLGMITRCEKFYEEVSANLLKEGKEGLYEDERLFISMIHRLNEQVLDSADSAALPRKQEEKQRRHAGKNVAAAIPMQSDKLSSATSTLRSLVEENAENAKRAADPLPVSSPAAGNVSEEANNGEDGDDDDSVMDMDGRIVNRAAKRSKVQ